MISKPDTNIPASQSNADTTAGSGPCGWLMVLIVSGLLLRFVLAAICWGTNDANTFNQFGFFITRDGLISTYHGDTWLNHPPIPAYWCMIVWRLTVHFVSYNDRIYSGLNTWDTPGPWFSAVFKIPALLADCAAAWLLYRIWSARIGRRRGLVVAALYAWCLDAILVSGYHCNTDSIYACLCLLCVYLASDRPRHFYAGLALAAAINVKLTPVLLIPPLLLSYHDWSGAAKFVAGLAIGIIPFVPVLYYASHSFYENAIVYKSNLDRWGIPYLLMLYGKGADAYFSAGRLFVLGLIGAWGLLARILGRWDRYEVAAVTLALFVFFASGFGVQYTVMVIPLAFAVAPGAAGLYGLLAGLFLLVVYWAQWNGHWPPSSQFRGLFPWPSPLYGLAAWGALGYFLARVAYRGRRMNRQFELRRARTQS